MNCNACQDWLNLWLDGETSTRPADLDAHLAACPHCRSLFEAGQRLLRGCSLLPVPAPTPELSTRIVSAVLADRQAIARRRRRYLTGFAVAASLLVAVLAFALWPRPRSFPPPLAEGVRKAPEPVVRAPVPDPSLGDAMSDTVTAMNSLAGKAWKGTLGLLPPIKVGVTPAPPQPLEKPAESLRQAGEGMSVSLQPVSESMKRWLSLVKKDLGASLEAP